MNLNEEKKTPLREKDLNTKREMVTQYIFAASKAVSCYSQDCFDFCFFPCFDVNIYLCIYIIDTVEIICSHNFAKLFPCVQSKHLLV